MVENIRLISGKTIEKILTYDELIPTIKSALGKFSDRPSSGVVQPVRTVLKVPAVDGFLGVMPAYSEGDGALSTKLLTFFPQNGPKGMTTHHALIVLFHSLTGVPMAVMDGDVITARRTAAASAVATKYLATGNPQKLAIIGAGVQANSHFHALSHLYKFNKVTIWNHRPQKAQALAAELGEHVTAVGSVEEAVADADVIVTATNSSTPVLKAEWVKAGAHINAVGSCRPDWCEIDAKLMLNAAVYVDSKEAAVKESGDIIQSGATIVAEIGEMVLGKVKARNTETTIFKSLGIAVEDAVSASLVLKKIEEQAADCVKTE